MRQIPEVEGGSNRSKNVCACLFSRFWATESACRLIKKKETEERNFIFIHSNYKKNAFAKYTYNVCHEFFRNEDVLFLVVTLW